MLEMHVCRRIGPPFLCGRRGGLEPKLQSALRIGGVVGHDHPPIEIAVAVAPQRKW